VSDISLSLGAGKIEVGSVGTGGTWLDCDFRMNPSLILRINCLIGFGSLLALLLTLGAARLSADPDLLVRTIGVAGVQPGRLSVERGLVQ
jgi:hypothetical protein